MFKVQDIILEIVFMKYSNVKSYKDNILQDHDMNFYMATNIEADRIASVIVNRLCLATPRTSLIYDNIYIIYRHGIPRH